VNRFATLHWKFTQTFTLRVASFNATGITLDLFALHALSTSR